MADAVEVLSPMTGSMEGVGSVGAMQRFWAAKDKLYVTLIDGGPEEIRQFDLSGKSEGKVPLPPVASVGLLVPVEKNSFLYGASTFTEPEQWFRYEFGSAPVALPFRTETNINLSDIEVRREFAVSKDGTRVAGTLRSVTGLI